MKKITIIVVLILLGKILLAQAMKETNEMVNTLYDEAVSAFHVAIDETSEQKEKLQAQREYSKCIYELSQNNDEDTIKKILDNYWINVSIENEKNDWQTKELFRSTIRHLLHREYSNETKNIFLYLEKFIFNPQFFEYGKKAILSEITHSGLYKNEPDYVVDLIIRMLEDNSSSDYFKRSALQLGNKRIIDDEEMTIVSDRINESQRYKDILFSFTQDKDRDIILRTNAMHQLAAADHEKCDYKDTLIRYIDDPYNQELNSVALMAVQKYQDPVLTQRAIDYVYSLIEEETGKDPRTDYSLFYTSRSVRSSYDGVPKMFYQMRKTGTDNIVDFFKKIIYAGLKLELEENYENRKYLIACIEFIGESKNPKAIPVLIDIYDNYSLFVKSDKLEKDRLKRAALIGLSYFEKDEIREIFEPRYREYVAKYRHLGHKRIKAILEEK